MIINFRGKSPSIHPSVFIADQTSVIGEVTIGQDSSIWFGSVLRGDINTISIGKGTNIQDNSTVHVSYDANTVVGDYVTVGHNCIIHGCTIGDGVLIGMGSTILDHAEIGKGCIIGAGSLVTMNKKFPEHSLIMGSPAKVIRPLSDQEVAGIQNNSNHYVQNAKDYMVGK